MLVYALGRVLSGENEGCVRIGCTGSHETSTRACRPTSTGGTIVRIVRRIGCIEKAEPFVGVGRRRAQARGALGKRVPVIDCVVTSMGTTTRSGRKTKCDRHTSSIALRV